MNVNDDLMFQICNVFKDNKDFGKIAIALDSAFAIGSLRGTSGISKSIIVRKTTENAKRLGIKNPLPVCLD